MIGIIGAMQSEIELLKASMEGLQDICRAGILFHTGKLMGHDVVLARSGMGKVNAAICAQVMIDIFHADILINTGIAGGVAHGMHVGDIVIGAKAVEHDYDLSPIGYAKGYVDMDGYAHDEPVYFTSDKDLVMRIHEAAKDLMDEGNIHIGAIATGDQFISDSSTKQELRDRYDAYAAEMEGGAILHVANKNGIKAVIIRCLSDLADENAHESIDNFEEIVADRSAKMLIEAVGRL